MKKIIVIAFAAILNFNLISYASAACISWSCNPYNWENSSSNWKNSSTNWDNSPSNWKNSSSNWNRSNGIYDNVGNSFGYVSNGNIFDDNGNRLGYLDYSVVDNIFEMHRPKGSPRPDKWKDK